MCICRIYLKENLPPNGMKNVKNGRINCENPMAKEIRERMNEKVIVFMRRGGRGRAGVIGWGPLGRYWSVFLGAHVLFLSLAGVTHKFFTTTTAHLLLRKKRRDRQTHRQCERLFSDIFKQKNDSKRPWEGLKSEKKGKKCKNRERTRDKRTLLI